MQSATLLVQPAWVTNLGLLQKKIYEILARIGIIEIHVNLLLDMEAMTNYWSRVFTHKSIDANPKKNYETPEFFGDLGMKYTFSLIIYEKFGDDINQANGTLLMNKYMSRVPF